MRYRFSDFTLDLDRYELRRGDVSIPIQPKVLELLQYLLANAGRAVSKTELLETLWADAVTTEGVLTQAVSLARRALGESAADAQLLRTVRGRGYVVGVPVRVESELAPGGVRHPPTSLAVLPFSETGEGSELADLAEGLASELESALAKVPELRVAARMPAARGELTGGPVAWARRLRVGSLVDVRLHPRGASLALDVSLVDAATGRARWTRRFEQPTSDLIPAVERVAAAVAADLAPPAKGASAPRVTSAPHGLDAYRVYLRAREAYHGARTEEAMAEAIELYGQAALKDPEDAAVHAALSIACLVQWCQYSLEPRDGPLLARASREARRALELDPESAEAHAAWARVACFRERDLERGEAAFRRSLELDPNRAESHEALASLLMVGGRLEEALRELERAISLDPLSGIALRQLGRVLYYLGDDEAALEALQSAELLSPGDGDITRLKFNALTRQGRLREADEVLLARAPRRQRPWLRAAVRAFGRYRVMRWYARRRMKRGRGFGGYEIWGSALLFAQVGDREGMYACMEAAAPRSLFYVAVDPVFDPYRGERRFQELLEREGYALP